MTVDATVTSAFVIGTLGLLIAMWLWSSRPTSEKEAHAQAATSKIPIGSNSKFVTLPQSGMTLRYTDTDADADSNADADADSNVDNETKQETKQEDNNNNTGETNKSKVTQQVTFLMLHGFAGVLETWEFMTPHLLRSSIDQDKYDWKVRVVALDMVGSGYSDKPSNFDYAYRSQGTIVSEFVSVLRLTNVIVVGHSSGTVVGAAVATQAQGEGKGTVLGAVFIGGALFRPKSEYFSIWWLKPLFQWMTTKLVSKGRKESLAKMHLPSHIDRVLTDDFVDKFAKPLQHPDCRAALVETIMAKEAPYEELVNELMGLSKSPQDPGKNKNVSGAFPMLFVWGDQDTTHTPLPAEQKETIRQKVETVTATLSLSQPSRPRPIVETHDIPDCRHYPQHEQPELLANEIRTFVQTNVILS